GEGRLVWVFPQGAERPAGVRPLGFLPGAAAIARLAPHARVVPLALRYEHQEREQPYVYVEIGTALEPQRDVLAGCAAQQVAVQGALERIDVALTVNDMARYERLLGTRPGRLARFGEWALSRLFG
ncbi:MAG: hypothetical protein KC503_04520, partial [Myxococcales bacterium]|nr:hypothetical protein [Myxococcales bacterium]